MPSSMQRPLSVSEIVKEASAFDHTAQYPLRIALRTAQNMFNAASACERTGNLQDAYLFLFRHAEFCMARIATHPQRKLPEFKPDVARTTAQVRTDLEKMEKLKPVLQARYDRWKESMDRVQAAQGKVREERAAAAQRDGGYAQILDAGLHGDLALRLAHGELSRTKRSQDDERREFEQLARNIKDLGRRMDGSTEDTQVHSASLAYPVASGTHDYTSIASSPPPLLPGKVLQTSSAPQLPPKQTAAPLESSEYTFRSAATTEGGAPLRPVFLPAELRTRFLSLAASNTTRGLETCGILCGSLISNALFISHLVVPDQTSTTDTCDTTDTGDAALFDYVDARALLVCGWIHTHPTQTCFLSSRDLHTHSGYQVMLPESVAIVCAPSRNPDYGVFRLTDPPGKQAILSCEKTGLFHPHEQGNLYTDALKPGHVSELPGLKFEVVDLRGG